MFDLDRYLKHLDYTGERAPSADGLRELHHKHMATVPFDNSRNAAKGLAIWDDVDAGRDVFFDALIGEGRGGICHEHSGLFLAVLRELGYDAGIVSAGVRGASDAFGPDLEHMMNVVRLDGEVWLADVGFAGPSFIEPVRVGPETQSQYGFDYRVTEDGGYLVLERRGTGKPWQAVYRFTLTERDHQEWKAIVRGENDDPFWHWAGEMIAAGTRIYGRAGADHQLLLVGRRFLRAENGVEHVKVLAKADAYQAAIDDILRVA